MKKIMFVGTASSVGKSLLSAGIGRILMQEGYRCAPFKSQNMSRNTSILKDGSEIASTQRLQAEACGVEADVRMGPIVLKPTSDNGSELIVHGKKRGLYKAREYYALKEELLEEAVNAFHALEQDFDVCVLEGAGGVAEINLRDKDLVNLGFAERVNAPVILIGDIDRGGVFASLYGSVALLDKEDQKRIKAFIINKFRGDVTLLDSGTEKLEELLGIPCMGIIPYREFGLEEEDSLNLKDHKSAAPVKAGVLYLPTITNFNDFHALEQDPRVSLAYIKSPQELEELDLILIPGSADLQKDLDFLQDSGLASALQTLRKDQLLLAQGQGICFLGQSIDDKKALGLLAFSTNETTEVRKRRINEEIRVVLLDRARTLWLSGYDNLQARLSSEEIVHHDAHGRVLGTSLHGIFLEEAFKEEILRALYENKGLVLPEYTAKAREESFNELAGHLREHLDLEMLYRIIE